MKKLITLLMSLCFLFGLTACGNGGLKDNLVDGYDNFLQSVSKHALTKDSELTGEREYGVDKYTGTYEAEYESFNGEEFIFGGTALERDEGNLLKVTYSLEIKSGKATLYRLAAGKEYTITSENGEDVYEFTIGSGDNYIALRGEDFNGSLTMTVE